MKVIINTDDFGLSKGVNLGVIEAFEHGVVRATSMVVNMNGFNHARRLANQNPALGVGIHLMLTKGRPITQGLTTIVHGSGMFLNYEALKAKVNNNKVDLKEVEKEFAAQIRKLIKSGIYPTHIDSHDHIHLLPGFLK